MSGDGGEVGEVEMDGRRERVVAWNTWTFAASGRETTYLPRALRGLAAAKLPTYLRLFVPYRAT